MDELFDDDDIADMREEVESSFDAACTFSTQANVPVEGAISLPCKLTVSSMTPAEIGLGNRTTPVSLMDLLISVSSSILSTSPNQLSSYRVLFTGPDGAQSKLHVIKYMGPVSNETAARIVCEQVGS